MSKGLSWLLFLHPQYRAARLFVRSHGIIERLAAAETEQPALTKRIVS